MPAPLVSAPVLGLALSVLSLGCGIEAMGALDPNDMASGGSGGAGGQGGSVQGGYSGGGIGGQITAGIGGSDAGAAGIAGMVPSGGSGGEGGAGLGAQGGSGIAGQSGAGAGGLSGQAGISGTAGVAGQGGVSGQSGTGGQAGMGGLGGASGQSGQSGAGGSDVYMPNPVRPFPGQVLPPTRAFLSWKMPMPSGKTVNGYEYCATSDLSAPIDDPSQCPGEMMVLTPYAVLDSLQKSSNYRWKVRARFSDGSASAFSSIGSFETDNSLAAWWRLDGNANDSSTNGFHGVLKNSASFASGLEAQALQCDGAGAYVDVGNQPSLNLAGPLSISAWFFANGVPATADSGIMNLGLLNYAMTYHTNQKVYFYIGDGSNSLSVAASSDEWHHVAGVFNGTTNEGGMKLYFDGLLAQMKSSAVATTGADGALAIGKYGESYFKGLIGNISIHSSELSETTIQNEYCSAYSLAKSKPLPPQCEP